MNSPFLALLVLTILSIITKAQPPICGAQCMFRWCKLTADETPIDKVPKIQMRAPGIALAPFICREGIELVSVDRTGEAMVRPVKGPGSDSMTPISKYSPAGLKENFPENYFGLFDILYTENKQGAGRVKTVGNQALFANDLCVVVPVQEWKELSDSGAVTKSGSGEGDCVAFRSTSPKILIELQWDSGDDLDLSVEEPDGDVVDKDNMKSEGGNLNNNIGDRDDACTFLPSGKENLLYKQGAPVEEGTYKVMVKHTKNCNGDYTAWALRVAIDGVEIDMQSGSSDKDGGALITTLSFDF